MKKLLTIILILVLALPALALADLPDISSLTYDELVELKNQINLAMWNSQKWQEVTVPVGVWTIGEDIPVGKWRIAVSPDASKKWGSIIYCDLLDESGMKAGNQFTCNIYYYQVLNGPNESDDYPKYIELDLKPNTYLIIEKTPMVFTPPMGKPDLGFK